MFNQVTLIGRVTHDPNVFDTNSGAVSRMHLKTETRFRGEDGQKGKAEDYHSLVAFGRLAEICGEVCRRGCIIFVQGRMRTRDVQFRDGRRSITEVVIHSMERIHDVSAATVITDGEPVVGPSVTSMNALSASEVKPSAA